MLRSLLEISSALETVSVRQPLEFNYGILNYSLTPRYCYCYLIEGQTGMIADGA